ncbi:hypothetical protein VF21_01786 [Pseudogymnoascus sp. 05NY08]|nr:hypothetical protein VF21_01786 [Pseudogymnoascus sp. 05NY08]
MSSVDSKAAQAALLHWVNTFPLDKEARSLVDLSDGKLLYQVMADIDPTFTRRRLNEKKTFQSVIRGLRYYIVTECAELEELVESPSFIAISADGKTEDILEVAVTLNGGRTVCIDLCEQLTSFLLVAAMSGPRRQDYISTIMTFDQGVQGEIKEIIEQRITEAHEARESGNKIYQPPTNKATPDEFQLEYRYGVLLGQKRGVEQENERLLKQTADLTTRLTHLQENNDSLQDHLRDAEDRLNAPVRDDETEHRIRRLEDDIRERDEVIESQEGQLEQDRDKMARMGRELSGLKDADSRLIQLQDEIKELEFKNDELTKKANTVDRYKNKLEVQKDLQKNFKDLELENEELKTQFQHVDKIMERNSSLEASQRQYQNSISKAEMEIFEIGSQKKMLEAENSELRYSLSSHEEKIAQYEQAIFELREQSPLPEISPHGQTLAEQMQNSEGDRQNNLENFRLKAENALLKGNTLAAQENSSLRAQLEEADAHRKVIEGKYREAFEKEVITQQQLRAMMNLVDDNKKFVNAAMSIGTLTLLTPEYYRDQAFVELKRAHTSVTEQLEALQKQLTALEAEHEDAKRGLLMATADLSMVEKEEVDALEELKATQESLSKSFENELTALKGKYKALLIDYEAQKSQLIESLLANNKIREALEKNTTIEETPIVDDEPKEVPATPTQPDVSTPFSPLYSKNWRIFNTRYFVGSYPKRTKSAKLSAQEIAQAARIGNHFSSHIPHSSRIINPATIPLPESRPTTARSEPYHTGSSHVGENMFKCKSLTATLTGRRSIEERRNNRRTPGKGSNLQPLWIPVPRTAAGTTLHRVPTPASFTDAELDAARFAAETVAASRAQEALVREAQMQREQRQRGSAIGKAQVKELEENGNDAQKASLERENDNLKREYSMMTMAWYDLSSRVQSNTVMLQRRSEVSKSWINKQRRAVNPTGRR